MSKEKRDNRMIGAVYGLAVGDALGAPVEFSRRGSYPWVKDYASGGPFNLKAGEWTDDTSCALAMAYALIKPGNQVGNIIKELRAWYEHGKYSVNGRCFDIGGTTRAALYDGPQKSEHSCGNGSIMRLSPAVLVYLGLGYSAIEAGCGLTSMSTHAHQRCYDACRLLGGIIARFINGYSKERVIGAFVGREDFEDPEIAALADLRWLSDADYARLSGSGYVVATLRSAIYCALKAETFEEALQLAVNLGEDTDTVGAVTGQIAGARWGYSGIPSRWITGLARKDMIDGAIASIQEFRVRQGACWRRSN